MEGWRPSTSEDDETFVDGHCGVYGDADGCSWTGTTIKLGQTDVEHCDRHFHTQRSGTNRQMQKVKDSIEVGSRLCEARQQ